MASFEMNDLKKIGLGLTGFGVFFTFLGVIFVFDKGLIAMGNILFLAGVTLTIGIQPAIQFFTKRRNFKVPLLSNPFLFQSDPTRTHYLFIFCFVFFSFFVAIHGTISFGLGFLLVVFGWPIFGLLLESYGFLVLFSGFWPTLAVFLQKIPILGWLLQHPYIRSLLDRYRGRRVPV